MQLGHLVSTVVKLGSIMRVMSSRHWRILGVIAAFGVLVAVGFFLPRSQFEAGRITQRKGYDVRFTKITQGTNHVVFSGSSGLAKLKRFLYQSPFPPLCRIIPRSVRAQFYSRPTRTNTTVLWVGWTHQDYSYTVTNGIPYSSRPDLSVLQCSLTDPGGHSSHLRFFTASETPFIKELVGAWEMPAGLTNWIGFTVHLREYGGHQDVVTIQLP